MYKITVLKGNVKEVLSFKNFEEAQIYKKYHQVFGNWNKDFRWVNETEITDEERLHIIDEVLEYDINKKRIRKYKIDQGVKFLEDENEIAFIHENWNQLRIERDKLLASTDWTQLADAPLNQEERVSYRKYRSYLRDLPKLHNDITIMNAIVYSLAEWKEGKR